MLVGFGFIIQKFKRDYANIEMGTSSMQYGFIRIFCYDTISKDKEK